MRFILGLTMVVLSLRGAAIEASDRYRSPRNVERPIRASTELIVLHTTEAPAKGSLIKVSERGECHYLVTEEGDVYRIVDRDREAFHAGRSMWNGQEDVDKRSIGIECVGYHDKAMSLTQLYAIRDLVKELKSMYRLSDAQVVTHSQVAYGAPNKWHRKKHRGRKQCGMLFAMPSVRRLLGLKTRVAVDPDVKAKRLVVGDAYLERVLYGNEDPLRATYAAAAAAPKATPEESRGGIFSWFSSKKKTETLISAQPPPPSSGKATKTPQPPKNATQAKKPKASASPRTVSELKANGYSPQGSVSPAQSAARIAGRRWNAADTYYVIRNKVIPGNLIDPAHIEKGMTIWMKSK